jgi:hypothetical protein
VSGRLGWLDRVEADALRTDRYLEGLLTASDRGADDAPADAGVDPRIRAVARAIHAGAVRVHPSFRFEERLARRIADSAAGAGGGRVAAAGGGEVVAFDRRPEGERPRPVRPIIVGGAITSAAISIAGAAIVAWRIARAGSGAGTGTIPLPPTPDLLRRLD